MATFFTSDTHFFHHNIIRYCERPFSDIYTMNEHIVESWNSVVKPNDTIFHLGDISFGYADETIEILSRLNGNKHLIAGNHDRNSKWASKNREEVLTAFQSVSDYRRIKIDGMKFVLCHFPLASWERGYVNLHGHTHGKYKGYKGQLDVGVDSIGPVPLTAGACYKLALAKTRETEYK